MPLWNRQSTSKTPNTKYRNMKHTIKLATVALAFSLASCGDSTTTTTNTTTDSNMDTKTTMSADPAAPPANNSNMTTPPADAGMTDQDFVTQASSGNVAEVAAHKAAGTHAMSADVKMHAKHMLTDHMKMGDEMKTLAAKKNMQVSMDPPPAKKQMLDDMNANKKGKDWDMAYLDAQVNDHNETIALFEKGSASVKDADLKALIDKTLPTLRDHLKMVQDAQAKMGK